MTYDIPDITLINSDILIKLWKDWLHNDPDMTRIGATEKRYISNHYSSYLHRASHNSIVRIFQDWIWRQGGVVILKDGKQYIQFTDPQQATEFLLRWL
jgi:hypothetical protein